MIFLTKKKKKFIKLRILARNKGAHANFFVENTQKIGEIQPGADKMAIKINDDSESTNIRGSCFLFFRRT